MERGCGAIRPPRGLGVWGDIRKEPRVHIHIHTYMYIYIYIVYIYVTYDVASHTYVLGFARTYRPFITSVRSLHKPYGFFPRLPSKTVFCVKLSFSTHSWGGGARASRATATRKYNADDFKVICECVFETNS